MIAIIEVGGKQFCVKPGQTVTVPRLKDAVGTTVTFSNILESEKIEAEILEHKLGDKVVSRKFRNKTRYQRTKGHRQAITVISLKTTQKEEPAKAVSRKSKKEVEVAEVTA